MVQGKAILVVDLGNSSTKVKVLYGKDAQTNKYRERQFEIPNYFAPIASDYEVSSDYSEATSTILRVDAELNGRKIVGDFCNGELQKKEKPLSVIKPSASDKKYNLDSSVLSYRLAFLFGYKAIMSMQRVSDINQLDITWKVVTLLPPGDIDEGRQPTIDLIKSIDKVESVFPKAVLDIKIDEVCVYPEGFCAYAGVVFDTGRTYRKNYQYLTEETVLVVDIGAGTTDICLIRDNKLVQNSKYTISQGGNNVLQHVRRSLLLKGYMFDDEDVKKAVLTGTIKDGSKPISIVDLINDAKSEVAQKIVAEVQNFLELTDIKARSVGYILICGGGSMSDSDVPEIAPLSAKVVENFKRLSPNSTNIELPKHIATRELEDGDVERVEVQISPRELNLIGASILAEATSSH